HAVIKAGEQIGLNSLQSTDAKGISVLLVEDQIFSRGLLRNYLEMARYSVTEAGEPSQAREMLASNDFDIVLVSLDLPKGGAFEVLDNLRNSVLGSSLPAIALTDEQQGPV